jgi:hypothetical protein
MVGLEKYHGTKSRHTCPSCNSKNDFTRFIGDDGSYIADAVGICNRASKCGYSYTAKQFFADNPERKIGLTFGKSKRKAKSKGISNYALTNTNASQPPEAGKGFDYIAPEHLKTTFGSYENNSFVLFLLNLFPDSTEEIQSVLKMYLVGTYSDYQGCYTCFPSLDRLHRVCRAKLIRFNAKTGKRLKGKYDVSSLVRKLKLKEDFNYKQVFFGEHLLTRFPDKPIAVVEAEKTAIIASLCMPQFVWLGSNSKQWLKVERLERLGKRQVILFPDADGFEQWQAVATDANRQGLTVRVSTLIETLATDEQKKEGYDIADYLIEQARVARVQPVLQPIVEPVVARIESTIIDYSNPCTLSQERVDALCNRF